MSGPVLPPRLIIAGTHSGVGKTTVATGIMAALRAAGRRVGAAKVGPDFIDPGYHRAAIGRSSRNLDPWISGLAAMVPLAARAAGGAEILVIEGVMGLFDGAADGQPSSTADVAAALDAPVVLVVDGSAMAQSVAAIVHGFATYDPRITIAGVIVNRIAGPGHEAMVRAALATLGVPVVGVLPRDDQLVWRDRHLGLIPVIEHRQSVQTSIDALAQRIRHHCDLELLTRLAATAAPIPVPHLVGHGEDSGRHPGRTRIAVAGGPAFSFTYPDNLEALEAAGAEIVPFDPCVDTRLPEHCRGLVAGGGFPEIYAEALAANTELLADVRRHHDRGMVIWAECGGLLWLSRRLDGVALAGIIDATATMTTRLTLGYRHATLRRDSPLGPAGTVLRGHEFHYSTIDPIGNAMDLTGRHGASRGGYADDRMLASYVHLHLGADPTPAQAFVERVRQAERSTGVATC